MGEVENERVKLISKLSSLTKSIDELAVEITDLMDKREYLREERYKTTLELADVSVLK